MYYAFFGCENLTTITNIHNDVNIMFYTFGRCVNLVNAPVIPNGVVDMYRTFYNCGKLSGNMFVYSTNISNAKYCFEYTNLTKNVYIPFKYENGVNTKTYNAFISAGYDTNGTTNGVYLKDINSI